MNFRSKIDPLGTQLHLAQLPVHHLFRSVVPLIARTAVTLLGIAAFRTLAEGSMTL